MVDEIIKQIHQGKMIDDMTKKYQYSRIPIFYKLTKIHKPIPVGRPIISGRDGPTERIYFIVEILLQPIAQLPQQSYIMDTTAFISFLEKQR